MRSLLKLLNGILKCVALHLRLLSSPTLQVLGAGFVPYLVPAVGITQVNLQNCKQLRFCVCVAAGFTFNISPAGLLRKC